MITIDDFKANTKEWLIDKLESLSQEDTLQTISDLYNELHKPKYPKTYKECCEILRVSPYYNLRYHTYEKGFGCFISKEDERYPLEDKLNVLGKVIICRNAYWKVYGEEMGLDKPWKPDWSDMHNDVYGIQLVTDDTNTIYHESASFTFPSEEILNEFCKNFKDLIEQCKELL